MKAQSALTAVLALVAVAGSIAAPTTSPTATPTAAPTAAPTPATPTATTTAPATTPSATTTAPSATTTAPATTAPVRTPTATTPTATTPTATTPTATSPTATTTPSTPTAPTPTAPTPTPAATLPTACTAVSEYRSPGKCAKCITSTSPFKQTLGGSTCVNPVTLSSKSTKCSPYILPAFPRKPGTSKTVASCISQSSAQIGILLVTKSSVATFLSSASYRKPSLRLGYLRPRTVGGLVVYVTKGDRRLVIFNDQYRTIRKQTGGTVKLTGTLRPFVGATVLRCFEAFIKVC